MFYLLKNVMPGLVDVQNTTQEAVEREVGRLRIVRINEIESNKGSTAYSSHGCSHWIYCLVLALATFRHVPRSATIIQLCGQDRWASVHLDSSHASQTLNRPLLMLSKQLPAGKNLIELSRTQDEECGVSMTSIIILNLEKFSLNPSCSSNTTSSLLSSFPPITKLSNKSIQAQHTVTWDDAGDRSVDIKHCAEYRCLLKVKPDEGEE
ncbi:hypothetical protein DFJ58DRAFT_845962 [Suillus subalutaceus]|uniref:uncharacterized protein n=1 Tax=Suillus subalutaceus TaxID=48586 RepID=UPI001B87B79D|nr:uncharacterized protein DFJ58DRAFT_845962 [Suillus subalutaceus]KAG1838732.1 hypothetical protein DFJ58DRAFT_845962 [Suillus subalutaceus]